MWHAGKRAFHLGSCYLSEKCVYIITCVHTRICEQGALSLEIGCMLWHHFGQWFDPLVFNLRRSDIHGLFAQAGLPAMN